MLPKVGKRAVGMRAAVMMLPQDTENIALDSAEEAVESLTESVSPDEIDFVEEEVGWLWCCYS